MGALESLRRRERLIGRVRWAAAVVVAAQVATGAAALWPVLVGLVLVGAAVAGLDRRVVTTSAWRRLGMAVLVADGAIAVAHAVITNRPDVVLSLPEGALVLLVLEGALRRRLRGGVWTALLAGGVTATASALADGMTAGGAAGLVIGMVLVGAFAGAITLEFDVERQLFQRMALASRDIAGHQDEQAMLAALGEHVRGLLDAPRVSIWADQPQGWVLRAHRGSPDAVPLPPGGASGPAFVPGRGGAGHVVVPVGLPDRPPAHAVVAEVAQRPGAMVEAALRSLAESTAVALATSDVIRRQEASNRRLERLEALRTRFVATVAHDLRSPLTAVKGVASILRDRRDAVPRDHVDAMLESVQRQANRLNRLADDLLDAARLDSDQMELKREAVDLEAVLHAVAADAEEDVAVAVDPSVRRVVGDGGRLERVVWNLVSNAVKYGRPPIAIAVTPAGPDGVAIEVRDHGRGLSAAQRAALFADFAAGADPDSVGLGLAIVWQLVAAHGGTVRYDDADPGARFTVTIPTDPDEPEPA